MVDEVTVEYVFRLVVPFLLADHHPAIALYRPTRCAIALTQQHVTTVVVVGDCL
jgi:hypothetical protein